jgi:hypothetical protein
VYPEGHIETHELEKLKNVDEHWQRLIVVLKN